MHKTNQQVNQWIIVVSIERFKYNKWTDCDMKYSIIVCPFMGFYKKIIKEGEGHEENENV